jgi:rhodanese-related sulfurtransferase
MRGAARVLSIAKARRWGLALGLCITVVLTLATGTVLQQSPSWGQVNLWIDLRFADTTSVSTAQLAAILASAPAQNPSPLLLDVRTAAEFGVSRLPGARHVVPEQALDFAERELAHLDRAHPIFVYCSVGVRSAGAARDLQLAGFTQVKNVRGSIFQWANEGRPLEGGQLVHPYNARWGQLLRIDLRSE